MGSLYASKLNAYWTGYFTSRPALKHYVRMMSIYYMVLRRKTEEASVATKQLRWLLESRKALLLKRGGKNGNNTATQLVQEIDHEVEVTEQLNDLCAIYERQIEEMVEEAEKLKDEVEALQQGKSRCSCQEKEVDSFEKDLDITDLKAQVVSLSGMVEQLRLHKAELDHGKSQDVRSQHTGSVALLGAVTS